MLTLPVAGLSTVGLTARSASRPTASTRRCCAAADWARRCAVEVDLPGRYPADVEACVHFCRLEVIRSAGAGEPGGEGGHGFVAVRDRLGAVGGELR